MTRGYAEPDPRDDLSGRDAARKGLILARMIGYRGAGAGGRRSRAARRIGICRWRRFSSACPSSMPPWRERVARGSRARNGCCATWSRRRTAKVSAGSARRCRRPARLAPPAALATSSRSIRAAIVREPLVISGPGAGADVTAAGLLNDICSPGARHDATTRLLRLILTSRVYDVARQTPLDAARRLSQRTGHEVFLKREDLQPIFTYKIRGAYNRMAHLTAEERAARPDHRQRRQSRAGRRLCRAASCGINALIVMPQTTPEIKIDGGARAGRRRSSSPATASAMPSSGATSSPPRADRIAHPSLRRSAGDRRAGHRGAGDPRAGAATTLSAIFVPIGGGGLIAGIAGYVKAIQPGRSR